MGMYDSIKVAKKYCTNCGQVIVNDWWQTKDGDCVMEHFYSPEDFAATYPDVFVFDAIGACPRCQEGVRVRFYNHSDEHEKRAKEERDRFEKNISEEQTSLHPNHPPAAHKGSVPVMWANAWCTKCKEEGRGPDDPPPGFVIPEELMPKSPRPPFIFPVRKPERNCGECYHKPHAGGECTGVGAGWVRPRGVVCSCPNDSIERKE